MSRRLPVLINRAGGTAAAMGFPLADEIRSAFRDCGREIELHFVEGEEIGLAASHYSICPRIVVGGGDGTLSSAAARMVGGEAALAILPLGTRNHLARQLGIPLDVHEAVRTAVTGLRKRIDIGSAGERVFLNNASFGLYTRFVRARDGRRGPKWLRSLPAVWHALRHMQAQRFAARIDERREVLTTPLLFIGNNRYSIAPGHLGERDSLDDGLLSISALAATTPAQMLGFAARALVGLADPRSDFEVFSTAREIVIEGGGSIEAALDGELVRLSLPLHIEVLPGALGVVVPHEPPHAFGAAAPSRAAHPHSP